MPTMFQGFFLVLIIYIIYYLFFSAGSNVIRIDRFVPYNTYEAVSPDNKNLSQSDWQTLNNKFGRLVQLVNSTTFDTSYQTDNLIDILTTVLNSSGAGKYVILSVGDSKQFTLLNTLIQDVSTLAIVRFKQVDFIVEGVKPLKVNKVIITPDKEFKSSQKVLPVDKLKPDFFQIQNPLHLFAPYKTSDDDMKITDSDKIVFYQDIEKKILSNGTAAQKPIKSLSVPVAITSETPSLFVSSVPPSALSPFIVGAGPLHPVGL